MYTSVFSESIPSVIEALAQTAAMQRLLDVGMGCGVDYSSYPEFKHAQCSYSRWTHSMGAARIVWHFTRDIRQAVAGLLHDIATPVFSHTIDFLHGDHIHQESTEAKTREMIEADADIMALLHQHGIAVDEVCDYHIYPIADNESPGLSADRLEYTMGNAYAIYHLPLADIKAIYDDLFVAENEAGVAELAFRSLEKAAWFTDIALRNGYFFMSDKDRFSMQYLADIIRMALHANALFPDDLYGTETAVIQKIIGYPATAALWEMHRATASVGSSIVRPTDRYAVNIPAKRRYINPLVQTSGQISRIAEVDTDTRKKIEIFRAFDFNRWIYAEF